MLFESSLLSAYLCASLRISHLIVVARSTDNRVFLVVVHHRAFVVHSCIDVASQCASLQLGNPEGSATHLIHRVGNPLGSTAYLNQRVGIVSPRISLHLLLIIFK